MECRLVILQICSVHYVLAVTQDTLAVAPTHIASPANSEYKGCSMLHPTWPVHHLDPCWNLNVINHIVNGDKETPFSLGEGRGYHQELCVSCVFFDLHSDYKWGIWEKLKPSPHLHISRPDQSLSEVDMSGGVETLQILSEVDPHPPQ